MGILDFGIEEGGLLVVGVGSRVKNVISMLNNEQGKYHLLYMGEEKPIGDGIDFYDMTLLLDDLNTNRRIPGRHKANICEFLNSHYSDCNIGKILLFVGMNGENGIMVSQFIASLLKEDGLPLFALVTTPFKFEGRNYLESARTLISEVYPLVDSMFWIDLESTQIGQEESTESIQTSLNYVDSILTSTINTLSDIFNPLYLNLSVPYGSLLENGTICIPIVEDLGKGNYKEVTENAFKRLLIGINGMPLPRALVIDILCSGDNQLMVDDLNVISGTIDRLLPSETRLEFHLCPIKSSSSVLKLAIFGCGYTQNDLLIINEEIWKPTEEDIRREKFRQRYKALRLKKAYEESKEIAPYNNNASCPRCHTTSTELEWEEFYWFDSDDKLLIEFIYGMCPKCHRRVFSDIILHDNEDDKE